MKKALRFLATAGILAISLAGMTFYNPATAPAAEEEHPGKPLYLKYCSSCHGAGGQGDGVVSGFLTPKPTDLTQLAKKNGGKFPFLLTMQQIDGTKDVRGHGEAAMPVWGESFARDVAGTPSKQARVRGRLMLITEYIDSLQQK
jgi:mono/diheme cytochrome c family protein